MLIANNTWTQPSEVTHVPWGFAAPRAIDYMTHKLARYPTYVYDIPAGTISDHRPLFSQVQVPMYQRQLKKMKRLQYHQRISPQWVAMAEGQFKARARGLWAQSASIDHFFAQLFPLARSSAAPSVRTQRREGDSRLLQAFLSQPAGTQEAWLALRRLQKYRKSQTAAHKNRQVEQALSAGGGQWKKRNRGATSMPPLCAGQAYVPDMSIHASFWQTLHTSTSPDIDRLLTSIVSEPRGFNEREVLAAWAAGDAQCLHGLLRDFNRSTASGSDGLPVAVLAALPLNLLDAMATSFRCILEGRAPYPSSWRQPIVSLLAKVLQTTNSGLSPYLSE